MILFDLFKNLSSNTLPVKPGQDLSESDAGPDSRPESPPPLYISRPSSIILDPGVIESQETKRQRKKSRRLFRVFKLAFLVLVPIGLVLMVIIYYIQLKEWKQSKHFYQSLLDTYRPPRHDLKASDQFTDMGVFCLKNATWSGENSLKNLHDLYYHADASFEIPLSPDLESFMLLSRGSRLAGQVRILDSALLKDVAKVHVTLKSSMQYRRMDSVRACIIEIPGRPNTTGIGFSASIPPNDLTRASFFVDVTVLLPSSDPDRRLELQTDLPTFAHEFDTEDLVFGNVNITTGGSVFAVSTLSAHTLSVQTSDAPIKGIFDVSQSLTLQTTNNYIDADITLRNLNRLEPTRLEMSNFHSEICSSITLLSTGDNKHAKFDVDVAAPDSALNLEIPSVPWGSKLHLRSATTEKPSVISLPSQYNGNFYLANFGLNAVEPVLDAWNSSDPRQSVVDWRSLGDPAQGRIVLEGSCTAPREADVSGRSTLISTVDVVTRNSQNTLILK